jgi:imidazolonepropionase-like amidohydrolase
MRALAMFNAGVPITAGTDLNEAHIGLDVPFGLSLHQEMENLVEAGSRPLGALKATISKPAHYFRLHNRGEIKEGKRADLVHISGDQLNNISNTRNIKVWLGGIRYNSTLATP